MEKIAKYYLSAEGCVLLVISLSGLYDPSFWFWGIYPVGMIVGLGGLVMSLLWYFSHRKLNINIAMPVISLLLNIMFLLFATIFLYTTFSGGINFMM